MKKLISISVLLSLIITLFPLTSYAATEIVANRRSQYYVEENGVFFEDYSIRDEKYVKTRYSFSQNAALSYNIPITESGNYEVYYFNVGEIDNRNQQNIEITSNDGVKNIKLNLRGDRGWRLLGIYNFSAGSNAKIRLTKELYGGAIRSGMVKLVKTSKKTAVIKSQEKIVTPRYIPGGSGILISNTENDTYNTYTESGGSFNTVALRNSIGKAVRLTTTQNAVMTYNPLIKSSGDYYILYYVTHNYDQTPTALKINIKYAGSQTAQVVLDCREHQGWVNLGKYKLNGGLTSKVETVNEESGKSMCSGGVYFIKATDKNFDINDYATPDNPGLKTGQTFGKYGGFIVESNGLGYSESGLADGIKNDYLNMDLDNGYPRLLSGSGNSLYCSMHYSADLGEYDSYEVRYYVVKASDNSTQQKIIIDAADGKKEVTIDCVNNEGWISLGCFMFDGTKPATITVPATSGKKVRSGGVQFIRQYRCFLDQ